MRKHKMFGKYIRQFSLFLAGISLLLATVPLAAVQAASPAINNWITSTNPLPQGIKQGATATYNGYVYMLGGVGGGGQTNTVYYAPLNADGSVGSWVTSSSALPQEIDQATAVAYNGFIYLIGGYNAGVRLNTIYYAPLSADGSVGSWTSASNTLPAHIDALSSTTANGYVYVMGGFDGGSTVNTVYYAPLNPNGSVGSWVTSPDTLPQDSGYAAAVNSNGYIYLLGIYTGASSLTNIDYAPIDANSGSVGPWTAATNPLLQAVDEPGAVILDGYLYAIGGNGGGSSVAYAQLNSNGDVGSWTTSPSSLPTSFFFGGAITYSGHIYVLGGQNGGTPVDYVYYTELTDPPVAPAPPSSPTTSSDTGTPATPDTGYGVPTHEETIVNKVMIAGAVLMGLGLTLVLRQKRRAKS